MEHFDIEGPMVTYGAGFPIKSVDTPPSEPAGQASFGRPMLVATATAHINPGDHVELTIHSDSGQATVEPYLPRNDSEHWQPQVLFGGLENREALGMVTPEELAAELLKRINPDWRPDDPHSQDTPKRFVASLKELCAKPEEFKFTTFPTDSDDMVSIGPIPFYTLCAHHVVPFHGNAWIGYVPQGKLCGLSKMARAVKYMSKGMWVQEGLTQAIHNFIHLRMETRGIAVVLRAEHMCMSMRGVQVAGAVTTTAKMSGVFGDHSKTAKMEFLHWMEMNK